MSGQTMPQDARRALASTIRGLRAYLIGDAAQPDDDGALGAATRARFKFSLDGKRVSVKVAQLDAAATAQRRRLSDHEAQAARAAGAKTEAAVAAAARHARAEILEQAGYTLLNRLVFLRLFEARGLVKPAVITGGWESKGYQWWREVAPAFNHADDTQGYALLLELVFAELAQDLPGLFGHAGLAELIPVRADVLKHVVEALNDPALAPCWDDELLPGWIYQYWNDPAREALDAKLNDGGKVERHEIASKTQIFTERYMVDWLLQNSLGPMWLATCQQNGWTPEVEAYGTLARLEARRADWRAKREAGEVDLTTLMPTESEAEERWVYYVQQPLPDDAVAQAPKSFRDLKLLDPACGSGHFLVVALRLVVPLMEEEARHRRVADQPEWQRPALVKRALEHVIHGLDLDPRAVQIAVAALWLEAQRLAPGVHPSRLNLVASQLRLGALPKDDPARARLRDAVRAATGLEGAVMDQIVDALADADHLGTLLKVDTAVSQAITDYEAPEVLRDDPHTSDMFDQAPTQRRIDFDAKRRSLDDELSAFLARTTRSDDLGLRLSGEQLAAGVRFVRLVKEGSYDLVVGNPPYQGTSKMSDASYVAAHYTQGKADLYAAFLLRGLELCRPGGVSALLTMRNWMFIKQYAELREHLLAKYDLRALGDFDRGAFEEVPDEVVSVVVSVFRRAAPGETESVAAQPTPTDDTTRDSARTARKRAAVRAGVGRFEFQAVDFQVVPESPVLYWWSTSQVLEFGNYPLMGSLFDFCAGLKTGDDTRFIRVLSEVGHGAISHIAHNSRSDWALYIMGAAGEGWFEPARRVVTWRQQALELRLFGMYTAPGTVRVRDFDRYFRLGVAFSMIGNDFIARAHRLPSVFGSKGSSIVGGDPGALVIAMNRSRARTTVQDLNPSISFTMGDVARLPFNPDPQHEGIWTVLDIAFTTHESHREPSVEFRQPGPSPWDHAQAWAQLAVDRPEGAPLPDYTEVLVPEPPTDHASYALGVALGRFDPDGQGTLDPTTTDLTHALPAGLLFLDNSLPDDALADGLGHPACAPLDATWAERGAAIDPKRSLRAYLSDKFFDVHRSMYENKPIHWPLSSAKRTFVAWVNIHRMDANTLPTLLADHLRPALVRLDGRLADLLGQRDGTAWASREAEDAYARLTAARAELEDFVQAVTQCAYAGPPSTGRGCPERDEDALYDPDLDDGVMINSAALWPLLEPQWKKPKAWWAELASAKGRKDYDWSHLAARYWPARVDDKCKKDPSLGVAHGCFWRYHPARAWKWELRLQDEIGPDFRIDEADSDACRAAFLAEHPDEALAIVEDEAHRRRKQADDNVIAELRILEPGLWSAAPAAVWALEEAVIEKQSPKVRAGQTRVYHDFRLLAPDEAAARAAFVAEHPDLAADRALRVEALVLPLGPGASPESGA